MTYRADIDGLRAIAILAVVFFHLDIPAFSGGYVGVDVFFVISGYLISSIIKTKRERQSFNFAEFYVRRIKRLLPALLVSVAGTLLAAGFILLPEDMKLFARSAFAALFSFSNIVFYKESGYWDSESALKPLLHTWSLGVEEQFYLFWPVFFVGLLRIKKRVPLACSLGLISVLGAALCIWFAYKGLKMAAFYLLPFRVFQFSIGALIIPIMESTKFQTLLRQQWLFELFFLLGLTAIITSIYVINNQTLFPGWIILLPTLGAMLVLMGGANSAGRSGFIKLVMENPASVWIGKVSYSMYLVHWPIISLYRYYSDKKFIAFDRIVLFLAVMLLTFALHYLVERRFYVRESVKSKHMPPLPKAKVVLRAMFATCLLAIASSSAWLGDGWAWRFSQLALSAEQILAGKNDRLRKVYEACSVDNWVSGQACALKAKTQVLIIGNSHETDGFNFFNAASENEDVSLISFGSLNLCDNFRQEGTRFLSTNAVCQKRLDALFEPRLIQTLDVILYAANQPYSANKKTMLMLLRSMLAQNPRMRLITLGGFINTKRTCSYYVNKTGKSSGCALPQNVTYFAVAPEREPLFREFREIESYYIDRVGLLCSRRTLDSCMTSTSEGIPMFYDQHHQSLEFAEMSGRLFKDQNPGFLQHLLSFKN